MKIYTSGDTSKTEQMSTFAARELDYALFPLDGVYNMGLMEGAECARLVGAKHNIPIHIKPSALFDRKKAKEWIAPNKLIIEPKEEVTLKVFVLSKPSKLKRCPAKKVDMRIKRFPENAM